MIRQNTRKAKHQQNGGVAYTLDTGCKIGGLPEVKAVSDCPAVGHRSPKFAEALYGGSKKRKGKRTATKKRKSTK